MSFSYLQNMAIYYPSGKCKLSIPSFLEHYCAILFVHNVLCPSKGYLVHDANMFKFFKP